MIPPRKVSPSFQAGKMSTFAFCFLFRSFGAVCGSNLTVITLHRGWSLSWRFAGTFGRTASLTAQGDSGGWLLPFFVRPVATFWSVFDQLIRSYVGGGFSGLAVDVGVDLKVGGGFSQGVDRLRV
ncbi:MAG: hypothetical protein EA381_11950 [Planctomycetaceae bacterium]|nr:MAG: hypothetical protein EA381_11950 [Planctomycetaceae bacterium]